jgi:hypothetical protein
MDPGAYNYYPDVTEDDGSCEYPVYGCTDETACNYNLEANMADGSCEYATENYDCDNVCLNDTNLNGVCDELELVCTDSEAINYYQLSPVNGDICVYNYQDLLFGTWNIDSWIQEGEVLTTEGIDAYASFSQDANTYSASVIDSSGNLEFGYGFYQVNNNSITLYSINIGSDSDNDYGTNYYQGHYGLDADTTTNMWDPNMAWSCSGCDGSDILDADTIMGMSLQDISASGMGLCFYSINSMVFATEESCNGALDNSWVNLELFGGDLTIFQMTFFDNQLYFDNEEENVQLSLIETNEGCLDPDALNFNEQSNQLSLQIENVVVESSNEFFAYEGISINCNYASCDDTPVDGCIYPDGFTPFNDVFGPELCWQLTGNTCLNSFSESDDCTDDDSCIYDFELESTWSIVEWCDYNEGCISEDSTLYGAFLHFEDGTFQFSSTFLDENLNISTDTEVGTYELMDNILIIISEDDYEEDDEDILSFFTGHNGPQGDDQEIWEPNLEWSCFNCNGMDLSDANSINTINGQDTLISGNQFNYGVCYDTINMVTYVSEITDCTYSNDFQWQSFDDQLSYFEFSYLEGQLYLTPLEEDGEMVLEQVETIFGCLNPYNPFYNPDANVEDGSCEQIFGCTDSYNTSNYNPSATDDDGSCMYNIYGCMDENAMNYDPMAIMDDYCEYYDDTFEELNNAYNTIDNLSNEISYLQSQLDDMLSNNFNCELVQENRPLYLPLGWGMFGFTCPDPINISDAFSSINDRVIIVKDALGNTYIPEYSFDGIGVLSHSRGYQIKTSQEIDDFSFCSTITGMSESTLYQCNDSDACNYMMPEMCEYPENDCDCDGNGPGYSNVSFALDLNDGLVDSEIYAVSVVVDPWDDSEEIVINLNEDDNDGLWEGNFDGGYGLMFDWVIEVSSNNPFLTITNCDGNPYVNSFPDPFADSIDICNVLNGAIELNPFDCVSQTPQYQVGDLVEGGIVFYVDETGEHGLVAALEDLTEGATDPYNYGYVGYEWGCYEIEVGAYGLEIGAGYNNTSDIVNQGCSTENGGITAAQAALDAEINGYSDWYLPSFDELFQMYGSIGSGGSEGNIGGFESNWYWSSTEYNNNLAWYFSFTYNDAFEAHDSQKQWTLRVRPIRSF